MKKIILFFIIVFSVNFSVRLHCDHYNIIGDSVEFACKKISGIDRETFEIIGFFSDYAKDKNSVYFREKSLVFDFGYIYRTVKKEGINPNTFDILE